MMRDTVQFWGGAGRAMLEQKRVVAERIIAASRAMPDARGHLLWLLTLSMESLQGRLRQIEGERGNGSNQSGSNQFEDDLEAVSDEAALATATTATK